MRLKWLLLIGLLLNRTAPAVTLFGHNLTPTAYTLPKQSFTAGNYVLGYGITDWWTVATSPWLVIWYNMPMVTTKFRWAGGLGLDNISLEASYFQTGQYLRNKYRQESTMTRLVANKKLADIYTVHLCIGYQFFFVDDRPYSLKLNAKEGVQETVSISALHEIPFRENWGTFIETGVLGVNYSTPYVHLGGSLFYRWDQGYAQVGVSGTSQTHEVRSPEGNGAFYIKLHPEIQAQLFF